MSYLSALFTSVTSSLKVLAMSHNQALSELREALSPDAQHIITYMQFEFGKMKDEFSNMLNLKQQELDAVKAEVKALNEQVLKLEGMIDDADAYERRDSLVLSGPAIPAFQTGEDCKSLVQQVIARECRVNIQPNDISTAHRLGKKSPSQQPDRRNIIVKFCRRDTKHEVFTSGKKQARPSQLYVNESLTPQRAKIYQALRMMRRSHPELIAGCSTYDGRVYAYTPTPTTSSGETQRNHRHLIVTQDALQKFCDFYIKKPLITFLSRQ